MSYAAGLDTYKNVEHTKAKRLQLSEMLGVSAGMHTLRHM